MMRSTVVLWILGFTCATAQVWGDPQFLDENPGNEGVDVTNANPAIATNGNIWITVWGTQEPVVGPYHNHEKGTDMDIVFSTSSTGSNWATEDVVSNFALIDTGGDSNPDIVFAGENIWVVVWETTESQFPTPHGTDDDIFYCFTTDNGQTWNNTNLLNNYFLDDGKNDALPQIACFQEYCVTVWFYEIVHSTANSSSQVLVSWSNDRGFIWSYPQQIVPQDSIPNTNPVIAVNNDGIFVVAWLSGSGLNNQILVSTSNNYGNTWSNPTTIMGSSKTNTNTPTISTLGDSEYLVAWTTSTPSYSYSSDNGNTWSTTPQPLGWDNPTIPAGGTAGDIVVVGDSSGIWVAAWSTMNKPGYGNSAILFSYSTDDTRTWSQNDVIAAFMMPNSTKLGEVAPCLATTGTGKWLLVWQTNVLGEMDIASVMTSYFKPTLVPPSGTTPTGTTPVSTMPTGTTPVSTTPTGTTPVSTTPTGTTPVSTTPTGTTPVSTTPKGTPSGGVRERVWGIFVVVVLICLDIGIGIV